MYKALFAVALLIATATIHAQTLEFDKPIKATISTNGHVTAKQKSKEVYLMNIKLTAQQRQRILGYGKNAMLSAPSPEQDILLPKQWQQGMNNVPVLDQGHHGSCVTFANTAAVNAVLNKGDYISQLCQLQLGSYLEPRGYFPSGWNGSAGPIVLNQMMQFGIISKENQFTQSCMGMTEYPTDDPDNTGVPMSLDDFKQMSQPLEALEWSSLIGMFGRFQWAEGSEVMEAQKLLNSVKSTLLSTIINNPVRITFGTLLPVRHCQAGACAQYRANYDTWAVTDAIKSDHFPQFGGHEMIITGYDDNAVAIDNEGKRHVGLLTLRNSWGSDVGDVGDFYMTYEFFKIYAMEVQKIGAFVFGI